VCSCALPTSSSRSNTNIPRIDLIIGITRPDEAA
jgi:hypothetical protein